MRSFLDGTCGFLLALGLLFLVVDVLFVLVWGAIQIVNFVVYGLVVEIRPR